MAISSGKIAEVFFDKMKETYENQMQLVNMTDVQNPDEARLQNAGNVVWYPVQQHRPVLEGFDLTGKEQEIIEETYPSILGVPTGDLIGQRIDDMRNMKFWEDAGKQSGLQQATELNKRIANVVALQGSKFYRSNAKSGYDFIAEGQAILNETQQYQSGERCFVLNDRANLKFGQDLAGRQTLQGRPEKIWETGQIGQNVAEFDVYTGSYLPTIKGGADPATKVTADVSGVPQAGTVNTATGVVTNVDYRSLTIPVTASGSYKVGDKVSFSNGNEVVQSIGRADKNATGEAMTFTIVAIPNGTSVTIYPKPIAANDQALKTETQRAYANINTQILNNATMNRLNVDASAKANLFWDKSAIEVIAGNIPGELFKQFDGNKVIQDTMSNGMEIYMFYDANIVNMQFRYRVFTWYGITMCNPQNAGLALSY